jgi:hypothetical protein
LHADTASKGGAGNLGSELPACVTVRVCKLERALQAVDISTEFLYTPFSGNGVLVLHSHKSAIMQFQHCGLRAVQV